MTRGVLLALLALGAFSAVSATVIFKETFEDADWEKRWTVSSWKKSDGTAGDWVWTAGDWYGDAEADKGIKTTPDARFFAVSSELKEPFTNKDVPLVLQYSVKFTQKPDCGGAYIKLLPASSAGQMKSFGGDTPYSIMFGPDLCGFSTKKVHVILTKGETNYLVKKEVSEAHDDRATHVYTLAIFPNSTYQVYVDTEKVRDGSIEEDWDIVPPKQIKDPDATKPEDWDERAKIPDPEDKKPEGYDDIPEKVPEAGAKQPDGWDEEEDGEWEPPMVANPDYKGPWKPKMIDNPAFKGKWSAPLIDNPKYKPMPDIYLFPDIKFVGFELWQVKSGSLFDNILLTDDLEYALQFAKDTWGKSKDAEKAMLDKVEEEEKKKEEEEAAKAAEESKDGEESNDTPGEEDDYDVPAADAEEPPLDEEVEAEEAARDEL